MQRRLVFNSLSFEKMFSTDAFVAKRSAEIIRRAMEKFVLDLLHSFVPVIIHQHGPPHALNDYTERKACPHCWRQALIVLSHRDDTISKAEIRGTSPGRVGTKVGLKIFKNLRTVFTFSRFVENAATECKRQFQLRRSPSTVEH